MGSRRWQISPNTEILMMSCVGLGSTLMESSLSGMKENLVQVWDVKFQDFQFSPTYQQLIKSFISGIVLLRGFTVHLYLASYLLLLYPVIMERLRSMLLFWLLLCGIRSVLVNLAVALAGCVLCSACSDLRPHCFEFTAVKALELGCSVYMWVNVNEFYQELKKERRSTVHDQVPVAAATAVRETVAAGEKDSSSTSSSCSSIGEEDEWSLPQSFLEELDCSADAAGTEASEALASRSVDSILAQAMVDWFIKKVFKLKKKGEIVAKKNLTDPLAPGGVRNLQSRVRTSLADIEPGGLSKVKLRKKYKWCDALDGLTEGQGVAAGGSGVGQEPTPDDPSINRGDKMKRLDRILMDTIYRDFDVYRSTSPISDTNLAPGVDDEGSYSSSDNDDSFQDVSEPGQDPPSQKNGSDNQSEKTRENKSSEEASTSRGGRREVKEDQDASKPSPSLKSILKSSSKTKLNYAAASSKPNIMFKPDEELVEERAASVSTGSVVTSDEKEGEASESSEGPSEVEEGVKEGEVERRPDPQPSKRPEDDTSSQMTSNEIPFYKQRPPEVEEGFVKEEEAVENRSDPQPPPKRAEEDTSSQRSNHEIPFYMQRVGRALIEEAIDSMSTSDSVISYPRGAGGKDGGGSVASGESSSVEGSSQEGSIKDAEAQTLPPSSALLRKLEKKKK